MWEWDIDISAGQLNRILVEDKELYHAEKGDILQVGLRVSSYIHTDDTGARHQGVNSYCTHIGNEWFAWFETTPRKNRINFGRTVARRQNRLRAQQGSINLHG